MQLVNDVRYRMGCLYEFLSRDAEAREAFEKYIHNREHGFTSLYDLEAARRHLAGVSA